MNADWEKRLTLMRQNDLFDRLKRTLGVFPASASRSGRAADPLVKLNLPPLMGRRDAAEARIRNIMNRDIFSWAETRRLAHYRNVGSLLDSIISDSRFILSMLSSPDTERREKQLLHYFTTLREMVKLLEELCRLQIKVLRDRTEASSELLKELSLGSDDEQTMNEGEICLANVFRDFVETATPKLTRYRAYAAKSFSPQNLERYTKAHREYSEVFSRVGG